MATRVLSAVSFIHTPSLGHDVKKKQPFKKLDFMNKFHISPVHLRYENLIYGFFDDYPFLNIINTQQIYSEKEICLNGVFP